MASSLGIDQKNVVITEIREGSVIIDYNLIVDSNSVLSAEDLQTLADIMISSGAIDIGGDLLDFESLAVKDEDGNFIEAEEEEEEETEDTSRDSSTDVEEFIEVEAENILNDASSSTTLAVKDAETSQDSSNSGLMVAAIIMCTILILVMVSVVSFVFYRQKQNQ
jgi:hypothetical protein